MKVQTGDDAKQFAAATTTDDKSPFVISCPFRAPTSTPASEYSYSNESNRSNYVKISKTCLLFLAIIATFLACLIFTRDLLAKKDAFPVRDVPHPQYLTSTPPAEIPSFNRLFDDTLSPFRHRFNIDDQKDDPSNKITRITFKIRPNAEASVSSGESAELPNVSEMIDDLMKSVMNVASDETTAPKDGESKMEKSSQDKSPKVHPKLLIIRNFQRFPITNREEDRFPVATRNPNLDSPAPIFKTFQPFPFGMSPMFPMFRFLDEMMKKEASLNNSTDSGAQNWDDYRTIISKMTTAVDSLIDERDELKNQFEKNIVSISNSNSKPTDDQTKQKLKRSLTSIASILDDLADINVIVKTENGALDMIDKQDNDSLNGTVDSFMKTAQKPLNSLISKTTELSQFDDFEQNDDLRESVVHFAQSVLDFGRLFSEDLHKLTTSLKEATAIDATSSEMQGRPLVQRKVWFFKSPTIRIFPFRNTQEAESTIDDKTS